MSKNNYNVDLLHPEVEGGRFGYRVTITYPPTPKHPMGHVWESPAADLLAKSEGEARAEARDRALEFMARVEGATVESLAPRGDGR